MFRLLIDENFDQRIIRGLRLRLPQLDYLIVQQAGMSGLSDFALKSEIRNSKFLAVLAGVIIVPDDLEIGRAIADLEIIIECATTGDLANQVQFLPL